MWGCLREKEWYLVGEGAGRPEVDVRALQGVLNTSVAVTLWALGQPTCQVRALRFAGTEGPELPPGLTGPSRGLSPVVLLL